MSANNFILINRKTFEVKMCDADTGNGYLIGKGKDLESAADIAQDEIDKLNQEGFDVEYGIRFEEKNNA